MDVSQFAPQEITIMHTLFTYSLNGERKAVYVTQSLAYVNIIPTHLYTPVYNTPLHTRLRYNEIVTF